MLKIAMPIISLIVGVIGCEPVPQPKEVKVYAFCGVSPQDPYAQQKANSLSRNSGITATMGPCLAPPANYTTSEPGSRYTTPDQYFALTVINANAGMKTIVYDARIWSTDPVIRQQAIDFWLPHVAWVEAWDMGDEFDPSTLDWSILVERWNLVLAHVTPATGIKPFTNHLGSVWVLNQALVDLPGSNHLLSFDAYPEINGRMEASLTIAREFNSKTGDLMCAINALKHGGFNPTASSIRKHIKDHKNAGCDYFLIFGGEKPIGTAGFSTNSLVTSTGKPTTLASAVKTARG
jgi:hypothetical protein